ncbi:cAMP and cAMP-inhibited cGMP 3',5'-cyclic phosphodiesterase-like protein [Sarcoptes scabiei]|uniref:3',5'-cyclic-GMP phosphodiesterase n=1 Tax=Sarcoptes scabiei TaxID=52283 RepID=A0A132A6P7_SARSC|nr:cAMP and cAMP-inhibited cGMP 3',5'-cyclic phosphodiesterase-like protein [Sarcoptes scabiei]
MDILCHKILTNVSLLTKSDRVSLFLAKGTGIVGHVAMSKQCVNIENAYEDRRFNKEIDNKTGYITKSLMCQPIMNFNGDVIGVAECLNKMTDPSCFTEKDEKLLLDLARTVFEDTTKLDSVITKIMMKTKSLIDCTENRVYLLKLNETVMKQKQPKFDAIFELNTKELQVNSFELTDNKLDDSMFKQALQALVERKAFAIFYGLALQSCMLYEKALKLNAHQEVSLEILSYHASATDEATMKVMKNLVPIAEIFNLDSFDFDDQILTDDETILATIRLFIDLELNEKFQIPYQGNNILVNVGEQDRSEIIEIIERCILSTDLAEHIKKKDKFIEIIRSGSWDLDDPSMKENFLAMLMTACDLSAICKPWPIQKRIAELVSNEFYYQGDIETSLNLNPIPMMDRKQKHNLAQGYLIDEKKS